MAKAAQVLSNLNKNFFDFFDFAVKKFCGSSLAQAAGYGCSRKAAALGGLILFNRPKALPPKGGFLGIKPPRHE
jgi:hypothetical protein